MGGTTFSQIGKGKSAREAFHTARQKAQYDYGHRGYTGSLAEKDDYVLIDVPASFVHDPDLKGFGMAPVSRAAQYADKLIADGDVRVDDKWGPAGCIALGGDEYLFFGWASS